MNYCLQFFLGHGALKLKRMHRCLISLRLYALFPYILKIKMPKKYKQDVLYKKSFQLKPSINFKILYDLSFSVIGYIWILWVCVIQYYVQIMSRDCILGTVFLKHAERTLQFYDVSDVVFDIRLWSYCLKQKIFHMFINLHNVCQRH